jgi:hypothetical protein
MSPVRSVTYVSGPDNVRPGGLVGLEPCSITLWWLMKYCRRQIEKSPLAQIEMSLSPVRIGWELEADDGDFDAFGDRSDERSA